MLVGHLILDVHLFHMEFVDVEAILLAANDVAQAMCAQCNIWE